ncbi:MAG: ABC transporter ATP-binding protein [Flavobacteriales bacterium]
MLESRDLTFSYANGPSFVFPDVHCGRGEQLLILGESGKGKTTFLHLLSGMLKPSSGTVSLNGEVTTTMSNRQLDRFRGQHMGIVFQTAHFVKSLSVLDHMMMAPFCSGKQASRQQAQQALDRLNIGDKSNKSVNALSVGEQQRVAIARAVFHKPTLLLADEPTSALDDRHASEVMQMLEEQSKEIGSSLIIVTHDQRLKDRYNNRIVL